MRTRVKLKAVLMCCVGNLLTQLPVWESLEDELRPTPGQDFVQSCFKFEIQILCSFG